MKTKLRELRNTINYHSTMSEIFENTLLSLLKDIEEREKKANKTTYFNMNNNFGVHEIKEMIKKEIKFSNEK